MLSLNLENLLIGNVNSLRYIKRFGTALTLHKESVSEHSFYVAIYAYFIARWSESENPELPIDFGRIFEGSLFHDLEESVTGDFPRPYKYRHKSLKTALDETAAEEFKGIISRILPDGELLNHLCFIWDTARDEDCPEGCIVALADYLSVLSHLWQEVKCSNASMYEHYSSVMEYLSEFDKPCYDFIRPIVNETGVITRKIFQKWLDAK